MFTYREVNSAADVCSCIPTWLAEQSPHKDCKLCGFCKIDFSTRETMLLCHWMYPCSSNLTKAHVITVPLHIHCVTAYHEYMEKNDYVRFLERIIISVDKLTQTQREELLAQCRSKHQPTGIFCGGCHVASQKGLKFFTCSKCLSVAYCSAACQKKNWPEHKDFCKTK